MDTKSDHTPDSENPQTPFTNFKTREELEREIASAEYTLPLLHSPDNIAQQKRYIEILKNALAPVPTPAAPESASVAPVYPLARSYKCPSCGQTSDGYRPPDVDNYWGCALCHTMFRLLPSVGGKPSELAVNIPAPEPSAEAVTAKFPISDELRRKVLNFQITNKKAKYERLILEANALLDELRDLEAPPAAKSETASEPMRCGDLKPGDKILNPGHPGDWREILSVHHVFAGRIDVTVTNRQRPFFFDADATIQTITAKVEPSPEPPAAPMTTLSVGNVGDIQGGINVLRELGFNHYADAIERALDGESK